MTTQELEKLSNLLAEEEALVLKELHQVAIEDPISGGFQPTPADYEGDVREDDIVREATITENNTAIEQELKHRLQAIKNAQEKIKNNAYGICEKCGKEIPENRLLASPSAQFCLDCSV